MIKGFAFDLDGVITDTAKFHAEAWMALCADLGIQWTDEMAVGTKGISRMDSLNLILNEAGRSLPQDEKEALADQKNQIYQQMIQTLTPEDILPGMRAFLLDLTNNHYHLALASASHNAPMILEKLGLADVFEVIVDPKTLKQGKPHPDIYLQAASLMGLQPSEVIGVEDAPSGIEAIQSAGEIAIGIGPAEIVQQADIHFDSTADLTLSALQEVLE